MSTGRILIYGYGNPGRQDDGLGPALAERIESLNLPNVTVETGYQLCIEDALALSEHDLVLFVDAGKIAAEPFDLQRIGPVSGSSFTTHAESPQSVLSICRDHFGSVPESWVLAIHGYDFELAEGLSPRAVENLAEAVKFVESWVLKRILQIAG